MAKTKVKWSRYIPHRPTPKQLEALSSSSKELLFGGALGGGKSDFLLMCGLQYMDVPGYASIIFRKNLTDLKLAGALLDRTRTWLRPFLSDKIVRYVPSEHTFYFPTLYPDGRTGEPARLAFGYLADINAQDRYQSAEFQTVCFDEISHWQTDSDYTWLLTRLRKTVCGIHGKKQNGDPDWHEDCMECHLKKGIPVRMRAATNPGGLGGPWIKKRWQIVPDPILYPDRREALKDIALGKKVPYVGTSPLRVFVPSYITDNPFLDQKDYDEVLNNMDKERRSQLRDGNWDVSPDSRFQRVDARYYNLYDDAVQIGMTFYPFSYFKKIFCTVDPASTAKESIIDSMMHRKGPSFTAISTWGVDNDNNLFWLDLRHFRKEIPEIVDELKRVYNRYRPAYMCMETNGVGAGPSQYVKRLGIPVKGIKKGVDKLENSLSAGILLRAGKFYLPNNAPWIETCEDELFSWTGLPQETDDIIDNFSDAANDVGPVDVDINNGPSNIITKIPITVHRGATLTPSLNRKKALPWVSR